MHESVELTSTAARKTWVPPGREILLKGRRIPGGMLYVGTGLQGVSFELPEPALIDPTLPIGGEYSREPADHLMPFWPSYSTIRPECRAEYLRWLEGGRRDPDVDMGYVSLFFYGLERRVLHDAESLPEAREELPAIAAEVERLLSDYGDDPAFPDQAGEFLDIVRLKGGELSTATPPLARRGTEPPLALRVAAARAALAGEPLSPQWALSWALCDPAATPLPLPAAHCPGEFHELFRRRYLERHGEGLRLDPCEKTIEIRYVTESESFGRPVEVSTDLPDVVAMSAAGRQLRDLLLECCDALRAYSRFLGSGDCSDTLAGTLLLPVEIFEAFAPKEFTEFRARIDERLRGRERAVFEAAELLDRRAPGIDAGRATRSASATARMLARAGFGMEPDPRFGGGQLTRGEAVVFPLDGEEDPGHPSLVFSLARVVVKMGVVVAAADGPVSSEEKRHLGGWIDAGFRQRESERRRLAARLEYLLRKPPLSFGARKQLGPLSEGEGRQVARFLVQVALADGEVTPREVKALANAYRFLGQEPGAVHEDIHDARAMPPATGPVPVGTAAPRRSGYAIPTPTPERQLMSDSTDAGAVSLDRVAIDRKLEETAAVSALLSGIFADEEPVPGPGSDAEQGAANGLDSLHAKLLTSLGDRPEWSRPEYDELARSLGLLPSGALDLLNDVAFEVAGAPLTEGEDPIEIDLDVHRELTS